MDPAAPILVDELVEGDRAGCDAFEQPQIIRDAAGGDVGRFALHVLTCRSSADGCVERRRSVAAVHADRLAPKFAHGIEAFVGRACRDLPSPVNLQSVHF